MFSRNFKFLLFVICLILINPILNSQQSAQALQYLDSLPPEIKNQFMQQQTSGASNQDITLEDSFIENEYLINEDIFGFSYFNKSSITKSPLLDIPLHSDYVISFNDQLELLLDGSNSTLLQLRVDLSGNVNIPDLGSLSLVNLTLSEAQRKIQKSVESSYIGTQSYLSVKKPSLRKISIIGLVNEPGTYLVNPFISISEAISYASGLVDGASLRSIQVKSTDGTTKEIDLYNFLIFGDKSSDINLKNGDTVVVPATSNIIEIEGSIHRPMKYEYKETDKFEDLISFALGFKELANTNNISTDFIQDNVLETKSVSIKSTIGTSLHKRLFIGSIQSFEKTDLYVYGKSVNSGSFKYDRGSSLTDIISKLIFSEDIYPFYAVLTQTDSQGLKNIYKEFSLADTSTYSDILLLDNPEIHFFSKQELYDFSANDYELGRLDDEEEIKQEEFLKRLSEIDFALQSENIEPEGQAFVALKSERDSIIEERRLEIIEIYKANLDETGDTLKLINKNSLKNIRTPQEDLLLPLVGKIEPLALINSLEIFEDIKTQNIYANVSNNDYEAGNLIDSGDLISLTYNPEEFNFFEVEILGEVVNPGIYRVTSSTTLSDLYNLAGGIKNTASSEGIVYTKEVVKRRELAALDGASQVLLDALINQISNGIAQSSDLGAVVTLLDQAKKIEPSGRITGDFSLGSPRINSIYLDEGDRIFVPTAQNTITVTGEVLNPTTLLFKDNTSYKEYIQLAGGLTKNSNFDDAYVLKVNGEAFSLERGVFANSVYPMPGDTIVIPRDVGVGGITLISIATKIISDIAFSAASLNAIQN